MVTYQVTAPVYVIDQPPAEGYTGQQPLRYLLGIPLIDYDRPRGGTGRTERVRVLMYSAAIDVPPDPGGPEVEGAAAADVWQETLRRRAAWHDGVAVLARADPEGPLGRPGPRIEVGPGSWTARLAPAPEPILDHRTRQELRRAAAPPAEAPVTDGRITPSRRRAGTVPRLSRTA